MILASTGVRADFDTLALLSPKRSGKAPPEDAKEVKGISPGVILLGVRRDETFCAILSNEPGSQQTRLFFNEPRRCRGAFHPLSSVTREYERACARRYENRKIARRIDILGSQLTDG